MVTYIERTPAVRALARGSRRKIEEAALQSEKEAKGKSCIRMSAPWLIKWIQIYYKCSPTYTQMWPLPCCVSLKALVIVLEQQLRVIGHRYERVKCALLKKKSARTSRALP